MGIQPAALARQPYLFCDLEFRGYGGAQLNNLNVACVVACVRLPRAASDWPVCQGPYTQADCRRKCGPQHLLLSIHVPRMLLH